jgi:hypothetical protein
MFTSTPFYQLQLPFSGYRSYTFAILFIAGNLLLPQLTHLIPQGGLIFLPIYFFTLIAAYKFGWQVGLLTAVLSPVVNNLLFGMPPAFVLPAILIKSCLLAVIAAIVAGRFKKLSLLHTLFVVLAYQVTGSLAEWLLTGSFDKAKQDFTTGIPGMLIQVVGGYLLLLNMKNYGNETVE